MHVGLIQTYTRWFKQIHNLHSSNDTKHTHGVTVGQKELIFEGLFDNNTVLPTTTISQILMFDLPQMM